MYFSPNASPDVIRRQNIEVQILENLVGVLLSNGFRLQVDDGEDVHPEQPTNDMPTILNHLMNTDEDKLLVFGKNLIGVGVVKLVYGNDGWDVISDYTTNLDAVLQPVNAYAETFETPKRYIPAALRK